MELTVEYFKLRKACVEDFPNCFTSVKPKVNVMLSKTLKWSLIIFRKGYSSALIDLFFFV